MTPQIKKMPVLAAIVIATAVIAVLAGTALKPSGPGKPPPRSLAPRPMRGANGYLVHRRLPSSRT
jgi:hypothetical protein